MGLKKQLLSFTCMFLPCVGFVLTCIGAYMLSKQTGYGFDEKMVPAYIMIVLGFLAMLMGVFWSLCHTMSSKMYLRRGDERHIQIFTVERPSFCPPSYEESQSPSQVTLGGMHEEAVPVDGAHMVLGLAPPLYTQNSSESPDCRWSWEQPPQYSQVVHTEHRQMDAFE